MPKLFFFVLALWFTHLTLALSSPSHEEESSGAVMLHGGNYDTHGFHQRQSHIQSVVPKTTMTVESVASTSAKRTRRPMSQETKDKISAKRRTRTVTDEQKRKTSEAMRAKSPELSTQRKGRVVTEETRRRISDTLKARHAALKQTEPLVRKTKKPLSEEHKAKISRTSKGRITSDETRAKMSRTRTGKTLSPITRAKIAESLKGKPKTLEHKRKISEGRRAKTTDSKA